MFIAILCSHEVGSLSFLSSRYWKMSASRPIASVEEEHGNEAFWLTAARPIAPLMQQPQLHFSGTTVLEVWLLPLGSLLRLAQWLVEVRRSLSTPEQVRSSGCSHRELWWSLFMFYSWDVRIFFQYSTGAFFIGHTKTMSWQESGRVSCQD